jgi:rubrerythrin
VKVRAVLEVKDMDIFQFAMEKEKFSEDYYRQLAEKTEHKGLKNIFNMLAGEESKHYKIVEQMSRNIAPKVIETPILGNAKEIFEKMRESAEKFSLDISELELYQKARDIEKESRRFYLEKSQQVEDACQKEIFKKLANEEQKHLVLLEKICDFVARPAWFLENAEMYRFDDYVDGVL